MPLNKPENAQVPDLYAWRIHYTDGSVLDQYQSDGTETVVEGDIFHNVKCLEWHPSDPTRKMIFLNILPGEKPILGFERVLHSRFGTFTAYKIGKEWKKEDGTNARDVLWLQPAFTFSFVIPMPDGNVALATAIFDGAVERFSEKKPKTFALKQWVRGLKGAVKQQR